MKLARGLFLLATALFAVRAIPTGGMFSREITMDWPELLGPVNRPDTMHLYNWRTHISENTATYSSIADRGSFWSVLWALAKCTPDGSWIKSMFDNPAETKGGIKGIVPVVVYQKNETTEELHPVIVNVGITDLEDRLTGGQGAPDDRPMWPFALAEAAYALGWKPGPEQDDIAQLLEIFTGRKSKVTTGIDNTDIYWEAISKADFAPVIAHHANDDEHLLYTVMSVAQRVAGKFTFIEAPDGREVTWSMDEWMDWPVHPQQIITLKDFDGFAGRPK